MQVKVIAECSLLEHSAILSTFIKLPIAIKTFVLFIFEWLFYTGFTTRVLECIFRLGLVTVNLGASDLGQSGSCTLVSVNKTKVKTLLGRLFCVVCSGCTHCSIIILYLFIYFCSDWIEVCQYIVRYFNPYKPCAFLLEIR